MLPIASVKPQWQRRKNIYLEKSTTPKCGRRRPSKCSWNMRHSVVMHLLTPKKGRRQIYNSYIISSSWFGGNITATSLQDIAVNYMPSPAHYTASSQCAPWSFCMVQNTGPASLRRPSRRAFRCTLLLCLAVGGDLPRNQFAVLVFGLFCWKK